MDAEFSPAILRDRIIDGAVGDDPVRLHGAIVVALELHLPAVAISEVFAPALAALGAGGGHTVAAERASSAIAEHLRTWRPRQAA